MTSNKRSIRQWLGAMLLTPSIVLWLLWIYAFNTGATHPERQEVFLSFFPEATSIGLLSLVSLLSSLSAAVVGFSSVSSTDDDRVRTINAVIGIIAIVMVFLSLFQLM